MKRYTTEEYFGEDKHLAETDRRYPRTMLEAFPHQPTLNAEPELSLADMVLFGVLCFGGGYLVGAVYEFR